MFILMPHSWIHTEAIKRHPSIVEQTFWWWNS